MIAEIAIIITIIVLVALDIRLWFTGRRTISQVVWKFSAKYPLIPFAAGLLCGHLFFPG